MSTGVESWAGNIMDIGPMYPFVGTEFILSIVGLAVWVLWHIMQISAENKQLEEENKHLTGEELKRVVRDHENLFS